MKETENYITIMEDTLTKKLELLTKIERIAKLQTEAFEEGNVDPDRMMDQLEQKDVYLRELDKLDDGFEVVYGRAHQEMAANKETYRYEIIKMQELIKDIASYTVKLQVFEEKNRQRFIHLFNKKREEIKTFNSNNKMAANYYKNMANVHQSGQSYFVDRKK